MDWRRIRRKKVREQKPAGVYTNLDDLIRMQFKISDFSFLPRQPVTSILSGRYSSRLRGRGLNFEELRRYQTGDDVRNMDWKVTARTRRPHVRVYTEEKDRSILIIVDQRINMFFGTKDKLKSVTAAELAAIGAWRGLKVGDRVGALVFNDTEIAEVVPKRSQQAVMSILGNVVRMNHMLSTGYSGGSDESMLNRVLEKSLHLAKHDVLVVLISDFAGVNEKTERLTSEMAVHNDVLAILVHDPIRLQPARQKLVLSDGNLQAELDFSDNRLRERIAADYLQEQRTITKFLRKISAPLLLVSNQGDVAAQLRKLLGVVPQSR